MIGSLHASKLPFIHLPLDLNGFLALILRCIGGKRKGESFSISINIFRLHRESNSFDAKETVSGTLSQRFSALRLLS